MNEDLLMARLLCDFFRVLLLAYYDRVEIEKLHPDNLTGMEMYYIYTWFRPRVAAMPEYFSRN